MLNHKKWQKQSHHEVHEVGNIYHRVHRRHGGKTESANYCGNPRCNLLTPLYLRVLCELCGKYAFHGSQLHVLHGETAFAIFYVKTCFLCFYIIQPALNIINRKKNKSNPMVKLFLRFFLECRIAGAFS